MSGERVRERANGRELARNAREQRVSDAGSLSVFHSTEDSIVSELRVNTDNELQVRMYLRMTHQRIGGEPPQ